MSTLTAKKGNQDSIPPFGKATEAAVAKAVTSFLQKDLLAQAGASAQAGPDNKPDRDLKVRTALDRAADRRGSQAALR